MNCFADHTEGAFEITIGGFEGVGINREWRTQDNEWCSVLGALDGLFEAESADCLNGDFHGIRHFAELIERAGHPVPGGGDAAALIVADVVDHIVTAEVFEKPRSLDHVGADHIVAHHFASKIGTGLDDTLDRLGMGSGHDNNVGGTSLCHHFGFEISAVHRL